MTLWIAGIGFVAAAVLSVLTLHTGAAIGVALLGRERCICPGAVNGCNWWILSTIASTTLIALFAKDYGFGALLLAAAGPAAAILLCALGLRVRESAARVRQFRVGEQGVRDLRGDLVDPLHAATQADYCCTGPASGYTLRRIVLYCRDGSVYTNGYVSEEAEQRDLAQLKKLRIQIKDAPSSKPAPG